MYLYDGGRSLHDIYACRQIEYFRAVGIAASELQAVGAEDMDCLTLESLNAYKALSGNYAARFRKVGSRRSVYGAESLARTRHAFIIDSHNLIAVS